MASTPTIMASSSAPAISGTEANPPPPHLQQRPGVMARLHALFPTSHDHHADPPDSPRSELSRPPRRKPRPPPKFIKVRMVTWNMHESLPKGDLEDLLGAVQDDIVTSTPPGTLPDFSLSDEHPYHLIVVAGQECPSLSGIPKGFGAGFKLKDKEREKGKEKEKEKESSEKIPSSSSGLEKEKDANIEEKHRIRTRHKSFRHSHHHPRDDEDSAIPGAALSYEHSLHHPPTGWTSMLEDWYVNGGLNPGHSVPSGLNSNVTHDGSLGAIGYLEDSDVPLSAKSKSTGDLNARMNARRKGPYQLLVKERMMGLYLAIFIHRDIKDLVRGTSRSAVTAGLIGGRVGNKGGVGVSVNLNGTTMLFINAHLAAHEGKVHHRVANYNKIKSELVVDDFLPSDDPRVMSEDLTDRFDFVFLCGDLNFRLDVTRLHADWMISRQQYEQALAFDQLRKAMEAKVAFIGFNEATINFPPTFKYDVLRYKRSKHKSLRLMPKTPPLEFLSHDKVLSEIDEAPAIAIEEEASDDEPEADGEAVSLASTAYTGQTKYTTDADDDDDDDYFHASTPSRNTNAKVVDGKALASAAVTKAKTKWMALVSQTASPNSPLRKRLRLKHAHSKSNTPISQSLPSPTFSPSSPNSPPPEYKYLPLPPTPGADRLSVGLERGDKYLLPSLSTTSVERRKSAPVTTRTSSTRSATKAEEIDEDDEKGVYDTSHKKRVPSWCDRILWKSNLEPGPELEEEDEELPLTPVVPRTTGRMGGLFGGWRPNLRLRKDSTASLDIPEHLLLPEGQQPSPDGLGETYQTPRAPFILNSPSMLRHSASVDHLAVPPAKPQSTRSRTHLAPLERGPRSRQISLTSLKQPASPISRFDSPTYPDTPPPVPPKDDLPPIPQPSSIWKGFHFLPFLRDAPSPQIPAPEQPSTPESVPMPPPRKGDVVCLGYNTLDDRQMRRLEGKSDHRPVIGAYALYI